MPRAYHEDFHPHTPPRAEDVYARNDTPSFLRTAPTASADSAHITRRIAATRRWLHHMKREVRHAWRQQREEQESASILCSVLRASSALLTQRRPRSHAFRCAVDSFLSGTPFLTQRSLCRYNIAIAEALSDEQLELMRHHVFDYDEAAFADLLYADDVGMALERHTGGGAPEAVTEFNKRARSALERLFAAPGGLADAVMRAASAVPLVMDEEENNENGEV